MCYNPFVHNRFLPVLFFLLLVFPLSAQKGPVLESRYPTGGRVYSAVYDPEYKTLYVLSGDRYLYFFSNNGELKKRVWLNDKPVSSLSIGYDHTVYAGFDSGKIIAVNPAGGIIWERKLSDVPVGNPVPGPDGTLYAADAMGELYALSHLGVVRYRKKLPASSVIAPAVNNHGIFIFGKNSRIYLFSLEGEYRWEFLLSGKAYSCALDDDALYAGTESGTVVCIDMDGRKKWSTFLGSPVYSLIQNWAGELSAVSGSSLAGLDTEGNVLWRYRGRTPFYSLSSGENILSVSDVSGKITFLNFKGELIGTADAGKPSSSVVSLNRGKFVEGSRDWNVYFTKAENSVVLSGSWKGWTGDNGGTWGRRTSAGLEERRSFDKIREESNNYGYLRAMSESNDAAALNRVLIEIEERLASEEVDRGKGYFLPLLEYIASDCITRPDYRDGELINDFPVIRSEAVRILGIYGDFRSAELLGTLLFSEWDDYTLRMIIRSLGRLGYDPDGDTEKKLYRIFQMQRSSYGIEEIRMEILSALEGLYKYNGTLRESGIRTAIAVFQDSSRTSTKEKALDLLKSLKK